jgi:molecular chaperone IbpA
MLKQLLPSNFNEYFNDISKFSVGFDETLQRLTDFGTQMSKTALTNWPPFNIVKNKENSYTIELAVAGFAKQDLDIEMNDGVLTVSGNTRSDEGETKDNYLFKGIAERSFTRQFSLADNVEIKGANLVNGMLKIYFDSIIPVQDAAKKIAITTAESIQSTQELLNEKTEK